MSVSSISALTGQTASTSSSSGLKSQTFDKDQFLKMLVAQLENQDPLSPPDASKFADQMTQFGQLEQLFNVNSTLDKMSSAALGGERNQAIGLIGKTVEGQGDQLAISDSSTGEIGFSLGSPAKDINVQVINESGQVVRTLAYSDLPSGSNYITFDGKSQSGAALPKGVYTFSVGATSSDGTAISVQNLMRGSVTGVDFQSAGTVIRMGDRTLPMQSVLSARA